MPRPAAGVSGKGMPGRRHRTADRQPGAGNSHIGLYVRRDAEASQVTVPAPLLRQGFLREGSGTPERMPESGRPGACSQSISRPAGLRRVAQTASTRSGGRLFLSGCSRGAQRTTAESHRPSEGHPHWPGHRKKAFSPDTGRAPAVKGVPARHAEVAQKHPQIPDVFRQSAALLRHSRLLECHFFLPALSVSLAAATSPSGRGKGLLQIQFSYRSTLGSPFGGAGA